MKRTIIKYKKIIDYDGCKPVKRIQFQIVGNVATEEVLPQEYMKGCPRYYKKDNLVFIVANETEPTIVYTIGKKHIVKPKEFANVIAIMKEAGARLHNILKKYKKEAKKLKKEWQGEGEILI